MMSRRSLSILLVALLILGGVSAAELLWVIAGNSPFGLQAPLAIGGPFHLTDQDGVVRSPEDFHGKLMLVYFGYTACPDICPTTLQSMTEAVGRLGDKAGDIQPLFITVDPARDTPALLKSYAANFSPDLVALTGTKEEIADVARKYRVFFQPAKDGSGNDLVDHSSIVYLMGKDGRYLTHFGSDLTPEDMAATIAKFL